MQQFKSKISYGLAAFIFGMPAPILIIAIADKQWLIAIFMMLVWLFVGHFYINTRYTIHDKTLRIKSGLFYDKTIAIDSIYKIRKTNNPLSAPALSLDRLELKYGKYDSVLISPKEKEAFIKALKDINPGIDAVY